MVGIVGRQLESTALERFLGQIPHATQILLLSGDAGIGKTTLWRSAIDGARDRGYRVLACRPTEAEAQLPFAALADLLGGVIDESLPDLPDPLRLPLEVALLRRSAEGAAPEPLAVSMAALAVVRGAAGRRPLLLAIDDAPWLDPSSNAAIAFLIQRIEAEPVGVLVAQRTSGHDRSPPAVLQGLLPHRLARMEVGPLPVDDVDRLLRSEVMGFVRPTLERIYEASGGNPFYALEIGRALQRRGTADLAGRLPVPDTLGGLVRDRLIALPTAGRQVALVAASLSQPTVGVIRSALGEEAAEAGLAETIEGQVISTSGDRVAFTHPLLAAGAYALSSERQRRHMHASLAAIVTEPDERAYHLALASRGPDDRAADQVEHGAAFARGRGAPGAAARLAEEAVRLTPHLDADGARRRRIAAAEYHLVAGDGPRARHLLEELLTATPAGPERAEVLTNLAQVRVFSDEWVAAEAHYEEALRHVGGDLRRRIPIHSGLSGVGFVTGRRWPSAVRHEAEVLRLAEELGDPIWTLRGLGGLATWEFWLGRGVRTDLMARAAELDEWSRELRIVEHPDHDFIRIELLVGDLTSARRRLTRWLARAHAAGDWNGLPYVLFHFATLEMASGNWERAGMYLDEREQLLRQTDQQGAAADHSTLKAWFAAHLGDVDATHEAAAVARATAPANPVGLPHAGVRMALGLLELSLGNAAEAHALLAPLIRRRQMGMAEPALSRHVICRDVEALVALGRLEEAETLLSGFEQCARSLDRAIAIADARRCRALLLGARGDLRQAMAVIDETLRQHDELAQPFDIGRTLLLQGEIRRRGKQKHSAREALSRALQVFEQLGARAWAERCRQELERTGIRGSAGRLTATERQIVGLVAQGRTNRQVADALFMSVHTVEWHLTRIYRTLGVRSRTELAAVDPEQTQATRAEMPGV